MPVFLEAVDDAVANLAVRAYGWGFGLYGVLSHLAFVPFIVRGVWYKNAIGVVLTLLIMATSTFYHACQAFDRCGGFAEPETRRLDHTTAPLCIVVFGWMVIDAIGARTTTRRYLAFVLATLTIEVFAIAVSVFYHPFDSVPAFVAAVVVALSIGVYYLFFRVEPYRRADDADFRLYPFYAQWALLMGAALALGIALLFFALDEPSTLLHSHWHVFIGGALFLFQEAIYANQLS